MLGFDKPKVAFAVTCVFLIVLSPSSSADWLYVIDREGSQSLDSLVRVKPDSQQFETVGPLAFNYRFGSMVWHPDDQKLLLVNTRPLESVDDPTLTDFYWVDPSTAKSQHLGSLNLGVQSSLVGYGITIDDERRVFISFTDLETYQNQIFAVTLDPLSAELTLNMGSVNGEVDSLEYDPVSGDLLSTPASVGANPANVYSTDVESTVVSHKCTVQLPEGFDEDPERGLNNSGLTYDSSRKLFWVATIGHPLVQLNLGNECTSNPITDGAPTFDSDAIAYVPVDPVGVVLNPGMNDAWYNPLTNGQGFYISVLPTAGVVSLAWFTFDSERPPESNTAIFGGPGQRWITALGNIQGNTATLTVYNTVGGVFDSESPVPTTDSYGTIELSFESCSSGVVEYDIPSLGLLGSVPIQRVANDNLALCEALTAQ